jgi:hypothetical protein
MKEGPTRADTDPAFIPTVMSRSSRRVDMSIVSASERTEIDKVSPRLLTTLSSTARENSSAPLSDGANSLDTLIGAVETDGPESFGVVIAEGRVASVVMSCSS